MAGEEGGHLLLLQRVNEAELENVRLLGASLQDVQEGEGGKAGGDHPLGGISVLEGSVEGDELLLFRQRAQLLQGPSFEGEDRVGQGDVGSSGGAEEGGARTPLRGPGCEVHPGLGVTDMGREAEDHGHPPLSGEEGRSQEEVVALLGGGWFEERSVGHPGEVTVVLLVLGGVGSRVVPENDHEASGQFHQGELNKGVGGDVEADALEEDDREMSVQGGSEGYLQGHLLVGGEFEAERASLLGKGLDRLGDLRSGGPWIGRDGANPRLHHGPYQGRVPHHDLREGAGKK
ncbi:MAG: hypothetical protein BWY86_01502 [Candidatus Aminicenantes bacterium ADurb.Bin508]|nr:MAG: hypothetical protein BWY86_01502 [Candidatus Aminicenantes bacterium ADurb.Bin508]